MEDEYNPDQYSYEEQQRIMRELTEHLRQAGFEEDEARIYYTREAISAIEYGE